MTLNLIEDRNDFVKAFNLADVCRRRFSASINENSRKPGVSGAVEIIFLAIANVHGFAGRQVVPCSAISKICRAGFA